MIRPAAIAGLLLALAAAAPATAQPPRDPIDDLLRPDAPPSPATAPVPPPFEPAPPAVPPPPLPLMPPPRGSEAGPVPLEQAGRTPDGPPNEADVAYDNRLRASLASSQGLRGAMDGGWSLMAGERELYVLELADRKGVLEGAWRDPRRPGVSGFIDAVDRSGEQVVLHFGAAVVTLHGAEGRWAGELREGERVEPVTLWRRGR